jgi:hypothetical protein
MRERVILQYNRMLKYNINKRMNIMGNEYKNVAENLKGIDHFRGIGFDRRILLNYINKEVCCENVDWIHLAQGRTKLLALFESCDAPLGSTICRGFLDCSERLLAPEIELYSYRKLITYGSRCVIFFIPR